MEETDPAPGKKLFDRPPTWWVILAVINLLLIIIPVGPSDMERPSPSRMIPVAFSHSIEAGLHELVYALACMLGGFFMCTVPALLCMVGTAITGKWLRFRTWALCFAMTLVIGLVVDYLVGSW